MVSIMALWLPILVSAVIVFVASSVLHMVLTYHRSDYKKLPSEDQVLGAIGGTEIPPGDYTFPHCQTMADAKDPAYIEKLNKGPVGFVTILPNRPFAMGPSLIQWFIYSLVVSVFAAYIAGQALGPGAHYLGVFRFTGCMAFAGYALALWQNSIWYKRSWVTTIKSTIDGLIYALLTAGTFGWMWPS